MAHDIVPRVDIDTQTLGGILARSGYFGDARQEAQAVVKVLAGAELGFPAIASMVGVHIIQGRVSLSANLIAAAIKRSKPAYDYRVREFTDHVCTIAFFEDGQEVGVSTFTAEDARKAGTQNMQKFPRNMLFARAMSNGAKWYCPAIFGGPVYTPEELGATVNEAGDVIDVTPPQFEQVQPQTRSRKDRMIDRAMALEAEYAETDKFFVPHKRDDLDRMTEERLAAYGAEVSTWIKNTPAAATSPAPVDDFEGDDGAFVEVTTEG